MRNHQAVIDTANGTINLPHVEASRDRRDEKLQSETASDTDRRKPNTATTTDNNSQGNSNHHQYK